ncbi:hypothetical protein [Paenibacillus physcomitrellae]|uniref:ABC transporter permease n=1 Tax=Paenibacillus physcomitrellae TaxID=1619311 RepID=A0ABQ1FPQ8_9BACL|nr:hypothetical protein [Paenibacillus physcomitrellae]GGA23813.1 ABC transporter permease [Paenibacillus physcomitrellae]
MFFSELKRGICNKKMLLAVIIGLILFFISDYAEIFTLMTFANLNAPDIKGNQAVINDLIINGQNKYHIWLKSFNYLAIIFPLLIVIPYSSSYFEEKESKYYYFLLTRMSVQRYIDVKFYVNFLVGGLVLFLPELIYYIVLSIFFRSDILHPFMYQPTGMFSKLFLTHPDTYIFITFIIHFILGACFTSIALSLSSYIKKKIVVYIAPFLIFIVSSILFEAFLHQRRYSPLQWFQFIFNDEVTLSSLVIPVLLLTIVCYITFAFQIKKAQKLG